MDICWGFKAQAFIFSTKLIFFFSGGQVLAGNQRMYLTKNHGRFKDDIDWIVEETILDIEQNPNWRIAIITRIKIHLMRKRNSTAVSAVVPDRTVSFLYFSSNFNGSSTRQCTMCPRCLWWTRFWRTWRNILHSKTQ